MCKISSGDFALIIKSAHKTGSANEVSKAHKKTKLFHICAIIIKGYGYFV